MIVFFLPLLSVSHNACLFSKKIKKSWHDYFADLQFLMEKRFLTIYNRSLFLKMEISSKKNQIKTENAS